MIININLANNSIIYYYDIEKDKSTEGYNVCIYRTFSTKEQDFFPVLKDIIIAKSEVDAEFFITKLNKVFKRELAHTKSFGQTAKQIVTLMNSYTYTTHNLRQPLVLSIPYLNGKPLPRIEKICLIDNNMYFITKYKKEFIMHAFNDESMKCMVPLSSIIKLYKRLKREASARKNIKRKPKSKNNKFSGIGSYTFRMEEIVAPTSTPPERIRFTSIPHTRGLLRTPRSPEGVNEYETVSLIEPLPPIPPTSSAEQDRDNRETIQIPTRLLERMQPELIPTEQFEPGEIAEPIEQPEPETTEQPEQVEPGEVAEPIGHTQRESSIGTRPSPNFFVHNNTFRYDIETPIRYTQTQSGASTFEERVETTYNVLNNPSSTERISELQIEEGALSSVEVAERHARLLAEEDALSRDERNTLSDAERDTLSNTERAVLSTVDRVAQRVTDNDLNLNDSDSDDYSDSD